MVANRTVRTGLVASAVVSVRHSRSLSNGEHTDFITVMVVEYCPIELRPSHLQLRYQRRILVWRRVLNCHRLLRVLRNCLQGTCP